MDIHNSIMDIHNYMFAVMDIHHSFMDIHNWMMDIMDIHNCIMDIQYWIMDIHNWIMDIHNYRVYALLASHICGTPEYQRVTLKRRMGSKWSDKRDKTVLSRVAGGGGGGGGGGGVRVVIIPKLTS